MCEPLSSPQHPSTAAIEAAQNPTRVSHQIHGQRSHQKRCRAFHERLAFEEKQAEAAGSVVVIKPPWDPQPPLQLIRNAPLLYLLIPWWWFCRRLEGLLMWTRQRARPVRR